MKSKFPLPKSRWEIMKLGPSKNGFINDNDNRCISGVCVWDFNLITSIVFVTCVRQLNTIFGFI